jgi:Raf kinase inhibitor-like YbhB/YbcL family protein
MPKDREQQTPVDLDDRARLEAHRGQGTAGTGRDLLPGEAGGPPRRIELTSAAFEDGDRIPDRFGRDGDDVSPPLEWAGVPDGTVELALLCEDPDAPGGAFTHWVLTGIEPSVTEVAEGTAPAGAIEGVNGFGDVGWGGPGPPPGDSPHRYIFTLFALSEPLGLPPGSTSDDVRTAVAERQLAEGRLVGVFER